MLDLSDVQLFDRVLILVRDGADEAVIGRGTVTVGTLISKPFHRLVELGSVASLELSVAKTARETANGDVKPRTTAKCMFPGSWNCLEQQRRSNRSRR